MTASQADINNLAWTMLGEASPNDQNAMAAVGNTVLNRLAAGNYGSTITSVVKADNQYAAWGIGDQAANQNGHMETKYPASSALFQQAQQLAQQLVNGEVQDNTGGAVNYRAAGSVPASWGKNTVNIGGNVYQAVHPISAGTQLVATDPTNAAALDAYNSTYGWSKLPDADPATGAPVISQQEQTAETNAPSPGDALSAIQQLTSAQGLTGTPSDAASAFWGGQPQPGQPAAQGEPAAEPPATPMAQTAPASPGASQAPFPLPPPATVSPAQANQLAVNSLNQLLQGSNVNLNAVSPAQAAQLVQALPTIQSMANDPKGLLNYLNQTGLMPVITAVVPSAPPNLGENIAAGVAGIKLPALLPSDPSQWNLPAGATPAAMANALAEAQGTRVPVYGPDTGSTLGSPASTDTVAGPGAPPSGNALSSWAQPYISSGAAAASNNSSSSPANNLASWAQPYFDANPPASSSSSSSWATPYFSNNAATADNTGAPPVPQQPAGADLASLSVAPSVAVPQYVTIMKATQVPADQPIEQGSSGVVWDAASQSYKYDDTPTPAAPTMVTKMVPTKVPNPAYKPSGGGGAAAPAAAAPAAATSSASNGPQTKVQQLQAQGYSPSQAYNQLAAAALATNVNGGGDPQHGQGASPYHSNGSLAGN